MGHSSRDVTTYFTGLAQAYSQFRPTYPDAAIAHVLRDLAPPVHAIDVGCGTGISTRLLASQGAQVIGIDPNDDMLTEARQASEQHRDRIEYRQGTGEQTSLPSSSAHLVMCAQSFHWFNPGDALREFHRILKPGGRLALLWNVRDDRDPFTAGYSRLAVQAQADAASRGIIVHEAREGDPTIGNHFNNARRQRFPNPQPMDFNALIGRARSASYFPKSNPLRAEMEGELRSMFEQHRQGDQVVLMHQTEVTLADRRS